MGICWPVFPGDPQQSRSGWNDERNSDSTCTQKKGVFDKLESIVSGNLPWTIATENIPRSWNSFLLKTTILPSSMLNCHTEYQHHISQQIQNRRFESHIFHGEIPIWLDLSPMQIPVNQSGFCRSAAGCGFAGRSLQGRLMASIYLRSSVFSEVIHSTMITAKALHPSFLLVINGVIIP